MTYRIVLSRPAEREVRRIRSQAILRRVTGAMEALVDNPYPPGARKLQGASDIWRIRIGDWRICYTVDAGVMIVLVLTVAPRSDVCQRLRRRLR